MQTSVSFQRSFGSDERGTVAVVFGLMFIVLTFIAGLAIDYSRIVHTKSKFAAAVDAATLAAGRSMLNGGSESEAREIAIKIFEENVHAGGELAASYNTPDVTIDTATGGVTVDVAPVVKMTLTSVLGFDTMTVPVTASTMVDQQDIELGIQLDLTGSMCDPCSKIDALKSASAKLVDVLLPDGGRSNKVRIALAPYSAGVNVGSYARDVIQNYKNGSTCAYDRAGTDALTDAAPAKGAYFKGKAQLSKAGDCPDAQIMPLTSNKDALTKAISRYSTGGSTAGQLGTNWAWNLISPKWSSIWPSDSKPVAYRDGKTLKAVILMTDGEYNTFEGQCDGNCSPYGTRGRTSNANAKSMCAAMRKEGVIVYTIGFQTKHPAAIDTLNSCATSPDHAFSADTAASLEEAFVAIAHQLNNLRLTN